MNSSAIRGQLVEALKLDLVGPDNAHAFAHELLPDAPSRWYLTGFLVPAEAPVEQKTDETSNEEIDSGGDTEGTDDASPPDRAAARRSLLPSSMGLSVLVPPGVDALQVVVAWGDYLYEGAVTEPGDAGPTTETAAELHDKPVAYGADSAGEATTKTPPAPQLPPKGYRREPREETVSVPLPAPGGKPREFPVPNSGGLTLSVTVRAVPAAGHASSRLPAGTRSVSVFLVNNRPPNEKRFYRAFAFQTSLKLVCPEPFVPRPDLRGTLAGGLAEEWDEQVADLQFRDVFEYAVGHGISATAEREPGGVCHVVKTTWIPTAEVEKVSPASIADVELSMEDLGALTSHAEAQTKLAPLVTHYRTWLSAQQATAQAAGLETRHAQTAQDLILAARHAADRIQAGIDALADPQILDAFRIANRAMAAAARQRELQKHQGDASKVQAPRWYPFQLAFILMNLRGVFDPTHLDRETVDLLFFPTGGGKTEAYLGLAAFSMVLRRLRHPGIRSAGVGTIAGVYETVIDELASRTVGETKLRPKIIASTATVRHAEAQIHALFERHSVAVFPPPGADRHDSFFAVTERSTTTPARLYVGVAAQGRSLKVVLLRAGLALLSAGQTAYEREGGRANRQNPADAYMTLLGYFNSLRELGGSRRIVEDEVRTRLQQYLRRKRRDPVDTLFSDRNISYEVLELTSRVQTSDVATAKRRLAQPFHEDDRVDVALATNMISVGLDIIRLGLMVVLGQPKTSAEYIQATSRVGRDPNRPGLVVTLLNVHKPRDRSHYERFEMYHATFYRAIEAASVTPFSPRALDRALAGALVALCRQGNLALTAPLGAGGILTLRATLDRFAIRFANRARNHDPNLSATVAQEYFDKVLHRCGRLLDDWRNIADEFQQTNTKLQYQQEVGAAQRLLYEYLHPDLPNLPAARRKFRANRSMRDVEPSVELGVKNLNDWTPKP